ncbi:MAG: response regulator [Chloroflexota bacterium]
MAEKILVVDDDLDTLRLVGLMLERQGYTIVAATSGQQALTLAKAEKPTLILLDLMMPDIDGVEVARQLRANPETRHTFIIMFTAKAQMEDKLVGFEAGADAYLVKPIQPRELVANVKAVLQRSSGSVNIPAREYNEKGELVALLSTRGGVGVTTLSTNLGVVAAALSKKPVVVSDYRPGLGMMALELGINNAVGFSELLGLTPAAITPEVVERKLSDPVSGVRFLLSSTRPQDAGLALEVEAFDAVTAGLAFLGRYIFLDLGPGLTPVNARILERCQQVVLVTEPVAQTLAQTRALFSHLVDQGRSESSIAIALVNRVRAGIQLSLGQVQDELGRPVSVVFTANAELAYQAQLNHQPMVLRQADGVTLQQFNSLAQKLLQRARA